uniref:Transposase IS110-like N-terminal domain-containing protein n=1 Tax=Rhodococcus sp. NS1 TaxID=402236 RepID=A0A097SPX1_9NOCA|nr:hypothetical protein LRS1606.132 [Rhodococcus sp. NS1]
MSINCGIDWAEAYHDVALVDENGTVLVRRRIDTGTAGLTALLEVIAENGGTPGTTPIAIETDKNLLVVALVEAGFTAYPINPRAVARYRERQGQAGGKSDPGDAAILANILRTDRAMHRPIPAISEHGRAIKALARQHQEAIWALHQTISRLRSVLLEFYPAALHAFPNLNHRAAVTVLSAAPTPASGRALTRRKVVAVLHHSGRRNDPDLVERILRELKTPALRQPPQVEEALGHAVAGLLDVISSMQQSVDNLGNALGREFDSTPTRGDPAVGSGAWSDSRRPGPGRGRRRSCTVRDGERVARVRRHRADHPHLGPIALRQSAKGPQQAPRRRLPLVGLRDPHQISRRTCPLRQTTSRRRPSQRRAAQPRQQAPRTHVVVSTTQRTLGRPRRLARPTNPVSPGGCLTPDPRGVSTFRWGRRGCIWRR